VLGSDRGTGPTTALAGEPVALGLATPPRRRRGRRADVTFWLAVGWLTLLATAALLAPVLPLAEHADISATFTEPAYARPDLASSHPLGTNNFGLDLLSRVLYGARVSLAVALTAVVVGMLVGGVIGMIAGQLRGPVDRVVGVLTNTLLSVPPLILLIALASVLSASLFSTALALAVLTVPGMLRVARANAIAAAQKEFVLVAQALGASRWRIMFRELLPSVVLPVAAMGMVMLSVLIVAEASLSFLGLGVQPPDPSWGNMIAEGKDGVLEEHPHVVLVPGAVLFLTIFSLNLVAEKARGRWDPAQSKV
jgi:peptide/nickel transport system permease protein